MFLDEQGRDPRLAALPRRDRKRLQAEAHRLGLTYQKLIKDISASGAGFEIDRLLRAFAVEYTQRYASSGLHNQPTHFNYIEPFCELDFIPNSIAPYAAPAPEIDHLFGLADFFDHLTSPEKPRFGFTSLKDLPERKTFHYTPNGALADFTFASPGGRDFLLAGFSIVRHGRSLHWCLVGGEVFTAEEWDAMVAGPPAPDQALFNPLKAPFLKELIARNGPNAGPPLPIEGAERAQRTVVAGEFDLVSGKHVGRYLATETENSFIGISDDPDLYLGPQLDAPEREARLAHMNARVEGAAVMWGLAEALFELPAYFNHRVAIARTVPVLQGKRLPPTTPRNARGQGVTYRNVTAVEYTDDDAELVRTFVAPGYQVETQGYWRRLAPEAYGRDADGNQVRGRDWVRGAYPWRAGSDVPRPIYIKSSVAAAKLKRAELLSSAPTAKSAAQTDTTPVQDCEPRNVLYVLRCFHMEDGVHKVGFTTSTASERARQLSAASGVPSAFVVMAAWPHLAPDQLEGDVHARLAPYRFNDQREFFKCSLAHIKAVVEAEIARGRQR